MEPIKSSKFVVFGLLVTAINKNAFSRETRAGPCSLVRELVADETIIAPLALVDTEC